MTDDEMSKFKAGDEMLVVARATLGDYAPGGTYDPFTFSQGAEEVCIPRAAIVSIERVRPALPGAWEWENDRSAVIMHPSDLHSNDSPRIMARVSGAGVETFGQAVELSSIAKVIEAVRNA